MASVTIQGACKHYGGMAAVRDVDLTVAQGEFVVLLGPSGCGKTTTLRMVAGFVQPDEGRILIGGEDVTRVAPRARNVGMVFQNYALFPNMNVAENIAFGLKQKGAGRTATQSRVNEMLELIQMAGRGKSPVATLSGGQQQRVALARALAISPRVLLMDEPLGALDARLRETMQIELAAMQRRVGITTVLVTHDQQEAMVLADRIVVMAEGRIQQTGTPDELYDRPRNRFVAEFLGSNNILPGQVRTVQAGRAEIELRSGQSVWVPAGRQPQLRDSVELAIRPQHVTISAPPQQPETALSGKVEERRFLGNRITYAVRLTSDDVILAECPAEGAPLAPGAAVSVTWAMEHTRLFDTSGQALHAA